MTSAANRRIVVHSAAHGNFLWDNLVRFRFCFSKSGCYYYIVFIGWNIVQLLENWSFGLRVRASLPLGWERCAMISTTPLQAAANNIHIASQRVIT